jgi:GntR family transcriptional repressor for pyruvate dehydrogenase complex
MMKIGQPGNMAQLEEVREILEPDIAALAASRAEEQHLTTMREAIAVMDRSQQDPDAYIEADLDFHLSLAEAVVLISRNVKNLLK